MASRLMRSIAHASSAPNIALVDAMSLIWLLLMLLVMVVLELLSSRLEAPSRARPRAAPGAVETRSFLPSLYESISPGQMRSYALLRLAPMYSCISITVIHSSRPRLPSGAAHFVACAMVASTLSARCVCAVPRAFTSARRLNRLTAIDRGSRFPEATLLGLSLAGGALGGIAGMRVAHHKTSKWYFAAGLPVFIILHVALFLLAHGAGLV